MKFFTRSSNRKLEQIILTEYVWGFPDDRELQAIPFKHEKEYTNRIAAGAMNNFAISLFKKNCSEIGFIYKDIESVYMEQNEQFFQVTSVLKKDGAFYEWKTTEGKLLIDMCKNLIVPKVTKAEVVVREMKRLSPEEQAKAMQLFAGKRIKITVEDI